MADDLFTWLDGLFTKRTPPGVPPLRVLHRFLASDPVYAPAARVLAQQVREPDLVYRTWQGLLPTGKGAPRLTYTGAKRPPEAEALVTRMQQRVGERRVVVEEMVALVTLAGKQSDLYWAYGVVPPTETP